MGLELSPGRWWLALIAAGVVGQAAAAAETGAVFAKPPAETSDKAIEAWANSHAAQKRWTLVTSTGDAVLLTSDEAPDLKQWPIVQTWSNLEYLDPKVADWPSVLVNDEVDCEHDRFRRLSFVTFRETGMKGGEVERVEPKKPEWEYPLPFTFDRTSLMYACYKAYQAVEKTP